MKRRTERSQNTMIVITFLMSSMILTLLSDNGDNYSPRGHARSDSMEVILHICAQGTYISVKVFRRYVIVS